MKSVILSFPDLTTMFDFIAGQKLSQVQTDSKAITLTGILSDTDIAKACTWYKADLLKMVGTSHYE